MFLENVAQLVLWLVILVTSLNLLFLFFLVRRRLVRGRFFRQKDAARQRYRDPVDAFALGHLDNQQAAAALGDAKSPAEREVLAEMLFAASNAGNTERISELLFLLGLVEEWAKAAFGRRAARKLLGVFHGAETKEHVVRWSKPLRPVHRTRLKAVSRALAVNHLGRLSPRYARRFLVAALKDPASEVRRVAVEGIGRSRSTEAIPLLVEELRKAVEEGNDLSLRTLKAALICFRLEDLDAFLPYLDNPNRRCRFFVTDTIRQICERAAAKSRLTKNDFSPALYRAVLEKCQHDEFGDVRARSCHIARYFRDQNATDMLRRLMQDENEFVRLHSLRASADHSYVPLVPDAVGRLTDERWLVREAAVQALQAMGVEGRNALFKFFVDCTDRFAAEQACDEFQRRGVVPQLLAAMAAGGDEGLQAESVARKMASMGKTSFLLSQLTSSDSFAVQIALMDTLAVNPTNEFVSVLSDISQQDSGQISSKARQVLSRIQSGSNIRFGSGTGSGSRPKSSSGIPDA
jgi:HEAT repeat protein